MLTIGSKATGEPTRIMEQREKLTLSGLQHFAFCRRQWALIFVEQQWQGNYLTAAGSVMHQRAHDATQTERRGDTLLVRGMQVTSRRLNVTGVCDVVEFHAFPPGRDAFRPGGPVGAVSGGI